MDTKKDEIIDLAKKVSHYCDLLIEQSDSWLSEEEGIKNMERRIAESGNKKRKTPPESKGSKTDKTSNADKCILIIIGILLSINSLSVAYGQNPYNVDALPQNVALQQNVALPQNNIRNARLDSLLTLLPSAGENTATALLYEEIGLEYDYAGQTEEAKRYYLKYKDLSDELDFIDGQLGFVSRYTSILIKTGLFDSIIIINNEALALAQQANNKDKEADFITNIGTGYNYKGYYEMALEYYLEALKYYESVSDSLSVGQLYDMTQTIYWELKRFNEAIAYGEKAVDLLSRGEDTYRYGISLLNLSNTYLYMYQHDRAKELLDKALLIAQENGYTYIEALACISYHAIYSATDASQAWAYAHRALEIAIGMNDPETIAHSKLNLGYAYIFSGRYREAEEWLEQALELAQEYDISYIMREVYEEFAKLEYARQKIDKGLIYAGKADSVRNMLMGEKIQRAAEELNIKYETEKKELEIARQQAVLGRHQAYQIAFVTGIVLLLAILILLWWMLNLRNKRNRALAEMNATKDKFFSIISHDLKNPAIAQRDALQLLTNNSDKWDATLLSQYYTELLKSANGQVELLYNLLNWAQVQTGRMPYKPVSFDLSKALRSDITLIEDMAKRKGIITDVQIPQIAVVTGDSNMITTVVRNLLTNAVKFTSGGNTVSLRIELLADSDEGSGARAYTVSVVDTGTGMSEEQLHNLFSIDQKQSRRGTAGESGSGLGLIVCKELIEKHGSTLNVESVEGKGSRFWFTLAK